MNLDGTTWTESTLAIADRKIDSNGILYDNEYTAADATTLTFSKSTEIIGQSGLNGKRKVTTVNWSDLTNLKLIDDSAIGYSAIKKIGLIFDFGIDWDGAKKAVIIDSTLSYTED